MTVFRQLSLAFFCLNAFVCTKIKSSRDAADYLKQFGYIPSSTDMTSFRHPGPSAERSQVKKMFTKGISMFQMYAGLNSSGQFDAATMNMMNMPRCGMAERMEIMENKNINMQKVSHKIPTRRKWRASTIYYRIANFPTSFEINMVIAKEEIRRAFRLWEHVANLQCIEVAPKDTKHADIDILFVSREHGDGSAFGQVALGNVVAHAFFPDHRHFEGDVHFDNERMWTAFNSTGINLFQVAAHEIGHALGLDHSRFPDSVMHMIVKSELRDNFHLHDDDIQGIQKLYGPRKTRMLSLSREPTQNGINLENKNRNLSTSLAGSGPLEMDFRPRLAVKDKAAQTPEFSDSQSQGKVVKNVNVFIEVPMVKGSNMAPELEPVVRKFWKCFSLMSHDNSGITYNNQSVNECYKQNVLRLLYSLNIL